MRRLVVRFTILEIMLVAVVEAAVVVWTMRHPPLYRLPLINAMAIAVLIGFKVGQSRPRMTHRRWLLLIAVSAALIGGAYQGTEWSLRLKEEVRARQGVVSNLHQHLDQNVSKVSSLSTRIRQSTGQAVLDPRHDRWVRELAQAQSSATYWQGVIPKFERLTNRPWEAYPEGLYRRFDIYRYYLSDREQDYLNRYNERWPALYWSSVGSTTAIFLYLMLILFLGVIGQRFVPLRRPEVPGEDMGSE